MSGRLLCVMKPEHYALPIPRTVERRAGKAVTFRAVAPDGEWSLDLEVWADGRFDLSIRDEHGRGTPLAAGKVNGGPHENDRRPEWALLDSCKALLTHLERHGVDNIHMREARERIADAEDREARIMCPNEAGR